MKESKSPPSRAAWIEIRHAGKVRYIVDVSPPSRAAWIEMFPPAVLPAAAGVAAFTGGVD